MEGGGLMYGKGDVGGAGEEEKERLIKNLIRLW